jgi:hypothetical protein
MTIVVPDEAGWYLDDYDGPRFWDKVDFHGGLAHEADPLATAEGECWRWKGSPSSGGYGKFDVFNRDLRAHRVAYLEWGHKIPAGYEIDHLCRNRICVRPSHLEAVTRKVNSNRGTTPLLNRGVCRNGHDVTPENVKTNYKGEAVCRTCEKARRQREYVNRRDRLNTPR